MKKSLLLWMGALTLALNFMFVSVAPAGEGNKLIDKLVEKNILAVRV